jgi:hypothetical protein
VSKRTNTKEGTKFRVGNQGLLRFFFWFWASVNAQELLEVTTKLPAKLNNPVIDVGT